MRCPVTQASSVRRVRELTRVGERRRVRAGGRFQLRGGGGGCVGRCAAWTSAAGCDATHFTRYTGVSGCSSFALATDTSSFALCTAACSCVQP